MSADNYLLVREDATVWQGFLSDDEGPPWAYGDQPLHSAESVAAAYEWATEHARETIVEYGVSLTDTARGLLNALPVPSVPLNDEMQHAIDELAAAAQGVLALSYQSLVSDLVEGTGCDADTATKFWAGELDPVAALDILRHIVVDLTNAKPPTMTFSDSTSH